MPVKQGPRIADGDGVIGSKGQRSPPADCRFSPPKWLSRGKEGDPGGLTPELHQRAVPILAGYFKKNLPIEGTSIADLVGDCLVTIQRELTTGGYKRLPGVSIEAWFLGIAKHVLLHHRRKEARWSCFSLSRLRGPRIGEGAEEWEERAEDQIDGALERNQWAKTFFWGLLDDPLSRALRDVADSRTWTELGRRWGCDYRTAQRRAHNLGPRIKRAHAREFLVKALPSPRIVSAVPESVRRGVRMMRPVNLRYGVGAERDLWRMANPPSPRTGAVREYPRDRWQEEYYCEPVRERALVTSGGKT